MYRPPRDAPQFRHGPPGPLPPGTRPRMMNTGRPFSLPVMQGRGPMTPPPFPGGQQHPGLGLPPPSMPPRASQTPSPGRPMPSAPPPGALPLPPDTLPPPPGTLPPAPPLPAMMPSRPRPSGTVPSIAPRGPSLGQPLPGPPPGGPSLNLLAPVSCSRPADAVPPQSVLSQASQPHSFESLPPQPPKPNDDEMIRNIEILSQFVIKNGPDFETMARVKQAGDPNFSFLFGGEPGSDAAIGLEYFQWFKMKCQLEEKMSKDGESRARPADPLGAPESSQRFTGPVTASEMASTFTAISDMDMDMDMEDDVALPMPATKDSKNVVEVESEMAVSKLSDQQQKEQTLSSLDLGGIDDREKDLMGVSENVTEASQSKFGEAKEICSDMAFKGPCVEDLSPVRPSPEELLYTLNVEKQVAESLTISKEKPHFVSDAVQERDAMHGSHHEASVTDPPKSSSAVKVPSEIVELAGKDLGENSMHNDMEFKEKEAAKPCYDDKSLDEFNNRNALEPDNMKSDTELHGKPDEGLVKVDRFGRLIRKGNSDSESEGAPYTSRAVKMGHSCSRSPSPGYERWRKRSRSRSPWRRSRWSRSRSRSPKRRRSGSRTPFHDFRRGGDARGDRVSRGRGAVPACNNFARGRCFRGASCKFLHQEATCDNVGRWSGAGRSRERIESRQDIKSLGGKENSLFSDVNKPKNSATDRLYNEPDTRNLGERKNQESYRGNDWAIGVCNDFSKGRCFRGAACRYLHQESGDNVGRWSGGGRGRERMESRQDITKSFGAKESSAGLAEKMKTTSPNRTPHEHYRHNLRDQRNQETDRGNDRRVPPCIYFARGFCQKGLSCRFLHQDATGDNGSRWSGAERGRFWKESRQDMPKSFGVAEGSAVAEMGKPMNTSQDRNSDGHGSFNSGKSHSQESERHNNSWVGDKGFIACDAYPVLRPPLSHSAREEFQPLQSQTLPKSLHHEDIGAHPLLQEGLCTPSVLGGNLVSHEAGENLRSESLTKGDSQVLVKDLCPTEDLHPKPFQNFSRDFPSLGGQCLSSGQSVGAGSLPMPHNSYQGISLAVSHLNVASNVDPPPPGCPTDSSVMNQPVTLSGLGGPTLHQHSPIATKPNSAPPGCPTNSSVMNQPANLSGLGGPTLHQHSPIATNPNITPPGCPTNSSVMNQPANLSGLVGPTLHQHSPIATKPNSAPLGCPTNSSVINQPANLSGFGGPTLHQQSPIATKPNSVSANTSADIPIAFTEQRSQCAQNLSEPFSLPQLSSGGQKSLMTMLIAKPPLSPPHMYKPGAPIGSAPLATFGEQQTYLYSHTGGPPAAGLSVADQPCNDIPVQRDKFEPLYGSIEPVSFGASENSKKNMLDSNKEKDMDIKEVIKESCMAPLLENVSPHDKVANAKTASLSGPEDVVGNNKHKDGDASSFQRIELCDAAQANINAGVGVVESESPGREGKNSSPVPPLEAAAAGGGGVGDIDMDQAHTHDESKKSKEIRTMKLFRSVLADFVKEVLKPTWREGHMSKEAFKTIVKKVVDKVAGTLQSHQIPKTQERIDQYVASSRLKLTKLVQGYVDKYVKS